MTRKVWTPREYQPASIRHMTEHKRCALWGTPGVGKTVVALTVCQYFDMAGLGPILILAPKRVARDVWTTECAKWEHLEGLKVVPMVGDQIQRTVALQTPAQVYTINYENIVWLIKHWGDRWPYKVIIADEADKLKGQRISFRTAKKRDGSPGKTYLGGDGGAVRANALGKIVHLYVERFIELTGTPATNGLKDLWGQLWFLDHGERLGRTYTDFMQRWFEKGYDGYEVVPRPGADAEIHRRVGDICLSIDAKDYFPLKDPVEVHRIVKLPPEARALYREMERKFIVELRDRTATAANAAVKSQKLMQLASGAVYLDHEEDVINPLARKDWEAIHTAKIEALDELIDELQGANLIVVYQFWSDLERLKKAFPRGRHCAGKKEEDDFKAGKIPILFVHPGSVGYGVDGFHLVCHHMAFFGLTWNLAHYLQMVERIGPTRQYQAGLDRNVFLYFLLAENTIDEDIMETRDTKREVLDVLMESAKRREEGRPSRWQEEREEREEILEML